MQQHVRNPYVLGINSSLYHWYPPSIAQLLVRKQGGLNLPQYSVVGHLRAQKSRIEAVP